jgi:hypothetical protein
MTQSEIKEMAKNMVGDGQSPNKYFVTYSPMIEIATDYTASGDTEVDYECADGFDESDTVIKVFDTSEEARAYYESIDLDVYDGICSVMIEDRMHGMLEEKVLQKIISIDYQMIERN